MVTKTGTYSGKKQHMRAGVMLVLALIVLLANTSLAEAGFKLVPSNAVAGAPSLAPTSPVVEGFADHVPLPVALRQILPRGTIYNIANDVDMGVQVSWKGGRPWQQVLSDALAAVGLQATVTSNTVNVRRAAYLNGNVSGTSEPIQLMPPVRLTPPLKPVVIDNDTAAPAITSGTDIMPPPQVDAVDTVDKMTLKEPVAAAASDATKADVKIFEITSNDADIKAEVAGTSGIKMGSPAGYLTLPEGAEQAAVQAAPATTQSGDNNLLPLDGATTRVQSPVPPTNPNLWEARAGQTLREVLTAWSERAGVEVNWQSEYDYPVQASLSYTGSFEEAVRTLLYGFKDAVPQPIGRLHKNDQISQQALLITTRGNIYEE